VNRDEATKSCRALIIQAELSKYCKENTYLVLHVVVTVVVGTVVESVNGVKMIATVDACVTDTSARAIPI